MVRAVWQGVVVAESEEVQTVDGYTYFPPSAVRWERLKESEHTSRCGWKGVARYWDVEAEGRVAANAAWSYSDSLPAAKSIEGWVGFWKGVAVER
jgi:uncharacterized protein (DUF427 family)